MNILLKVLGITFGILFIFGAIVQYNDPDPFLWICIYCIASAVSFASAFNKVPYKLLLILGGAFLMGFIIAYPESFEGFEIGKGDIKNVEEAREAYGLLLMAIVMLLFGGLSFFRRK